TLGSLITKLLGFAGVGAAFVFGPLGNGTVWGRVMTAALGPDGSQYATIFAFQVLPTIIFIAALFAILYYFGVMQVIVHLFAIVMAKMLVPETEVPKTMGTVKLEVEKTDVNVIDAAGRGTGEGLHLALNVGAMLISFLALVALVNALLGLANLSLQQIFGWVF